MTERGDEPSAKGRAARAKLEMAQQMLKNAGDAPGPASANEKQHEAIRLMKQAERELGQTPGQSKKLEDQLERSGLPDRSPGSAGRKVDSGDSFRSARDGVSLPDISGKGGKLEQPSTMELAQLRESFSTERTDDHLRHADLDRLRRSFSQVDDASSPREGFDELRDNLAKAVPGQEPPSVDLNRLRDRSTDQPRDSAGHRSSRDGVRLPDISGPGVPGGKRTQREEGQTQGTAGNKRLDKLENQAVLPSDRPEDAPERPEAVRGFERFKQEWQQRRQYVFVAQVGRDGNFEKGALAYLRMKYPEHSLVRVKSWQDINRRLGNDNRMKPGKIGDIILVSHGNEHGVLKLPLTDADAKATTPDEVHNPVSPWSVAEVGRAMRQSEAEAFKQERQAALTSIDARSRIMVEACNFGLSKDGLEAVHALLGGKATVYGRDGLAQFGFQPIGRGEAPIYASFEQAYDAMAAQDHLPQGVQATSSEEKRAYIKEVWNRNNGSIPDQSLVRGENVRLFRELPKRVQRNPTSAAAEQLKTRPEMSRPISDEQAYADRLSNRELQEQARSLKQNYRPESEPLLAAMRDSWTDRVRREPGSQLPADMQVAAGDPNDPLYTLPPSDIFGSKEPGVETGANVNVFWIPFGDAASAQTQPQADPLLSADSKLGSTLTEAERTQSEKNFHEELLNNLAAAPRREKPSSSHGFVGPLENGGISLWNFQSGRADLRQEFIQPLQQVAERARANPSLTIRVDGHASSSGASARNQDISQARADAVRHFLIEAGVPTGQIDYQWHGESQRRAAEAGPDGEINPKRAAQNRRVEIRLAQPNLASDSASGNTLAEAAVKEQVAKFTSKADDRFGDIVNTISLANDVYGHVTELLGVANKWVFASQAVLGPVLAALDYYAFARSVQTMKDAWGRNAQLVGLRIGLEGARMLAAENNLDRPITADDLEGALNLKLAFEHPEHPEALKYVSKENQREFAELTRVGPVSTVRAGRFQEMIRQGLEKDAALVNEVIQAAEADFRRALEASGRSPELVERDYQAHVRELRYGCVELLEKQLKQALKEQDR